MKGMFGRSLSPARERPCKTAGTVAGTVAPVGPRKPVDDPKDAQVILHMPQIGAVQVFQDPMVAGTNDIQELSKTHDVLSRSKTELWHPLPGRRLRSNLPKGAS